LLPLNPEQLVRSIRSQFQALNLNAMILS